MTDKNTIILKATAELEDIELRKWVTKLQVKIETLNDRTKRQTFQIRELEKEVKKLKEESQKSYSKKEIINLINKAPDIDYVGEYLKEELK